MELTPGSPACPWDSDAFGRIGAMPRTSEVVSHHHKTLRENNSLRNELKVVQHELNALKAAWKAKRAQEEGAARQWEERIKEVELDNEQLKEENKELKEEREKLLARDQELQQEKDKNWEDKQLIQCLNRKIYDLHDKYEKVRTRNYSLENELKELEHEFDGAMQSYGESVISTYKGALAILEKQVEELTERNVTLVEERHALKEELKKLESQMIAVGNDQTLPFTGVIEKLLGTVLQRLSVDDQGLQDRDSPVHPDTMFQVPASFWNLINTIADRSEHSKEAPSKQCSNCGITSSRSVSSEAFPVPEINASPCKEVTDSLKRRLHSAFEGAALSSPAEMEYGIQKVLKLSECGA